MRTSPVHYIAPSAISITPNANGSHRDLAVYVAEGTKIKVLCPRAGINYVNNEYQEWELSGRNRRLADETGSIPYTIYARLPKNDKSNGYLVFAAKTPLGDEWVDKHLYITNDTPDGLADLEGFFSVDDNWWVRLGDVSDVNESGQRTVTLDTGILGTEQFNDEWSLNPDLLPLRIELSCTIDDEDAGPTPYVYWGQRLVLTATLTEGWTGTDIQRFDHWEIKRDSGDSEADAQWSAGAAFAQSGSLTLSHLRDVDDFNGAVSSTFTVMAMEQNPYYSSEEPDENVPEYLVLKTATINIHAEIIEKYELALSANIVGYNPMKPAYDPASITVRIRATDQRGDVFELTRGQLDDARLVVQYAAVGSVDWDILNFTGSSDAIATADLTSATVFAAQKNLNIRLLRTADDTELMQQTIAFVRHGEDSKVREWIYRLNSQEDYSGTTGTAGGQAISGTVTIDAESIPKCRVTDDFVPTGWSDDPTGVSNPGDIEYESWRDYDEATRRWGTFHTPVIHNRYAEDAYTVQANPPTVSFDCDSDGKSVDVNVKGITLSMFKGSDAESFTASVTNATRCTAWVSGSALHISTGMGWRNGGDVVYTMKPYPYVSVGDTVYKANGQVVGTVTDTGTVYITIDGVRYDGVSDLSYYNLSQGGSVSATLTSGSVSRTLTIPVTGNRQGEDGDGALTYRILTDRDSITIPSDALSTTSSITASFFKREGQNAEEAHSCYYAFYRRRGANYTRIANAGSTKYTTKTLSVTVSSESSSRNYADAIVIFMSDSVLSASTIASVPPTSYLAKCEIAVLKLGDTGGKGDDAINVQLSSDSIILSQATASPYAVDVTNAFTDAMVFLGTAHPSDFTVLVNTAYHCTASIDETNSKRVKINAISKSNGVYYDSGYVLIDVKYNGVTYQKKFNFYVNLLGTWKETVIGDTKTEVAERLSYGYDGTTTKTLEDIGLYIKSSEENISNLQSTVGDSNGGLVKDMSDIRQTASEISLKVSKTALANLLPDPIQKEDTIFTGTGGASGITTALSQFTAGSNNNVEDPWDGAGGRIIQFAITSNTATSAGNVWAVPHPARLLLKPNTPYTFSVWVSFSDKSKMSSSSLVAEISLWASNTSSSRNTYRFSIDSKTGRAAGKFIQYSYTFTTSSYLYFSWLPMFTVLAGQSGMNVQYAGAKLEVGDTATDMAFDYSDAVKTEVENRLLATGIDITNEEILITSDNFRIRNRMGDESMYVDQYGDVAIAGYLSEKIMVINNAEEWTARFFPVKGLLNLVDGETPTSGDVTVYGQEENLIFTGYSMQMNVDSFTPASHELTPLIGKHWGAGYENYGMLDLHRCTGIIDIDFQPRTSGGSLVENVVFLPWIHFNTGDACSEVSLPASDAMAVRLAPYSGTNRYKGSQLYTDGDREVRKYPPYTANLRHGAPTTGVAAATNILPNNYTLYFNIQLQNMVNYGIMFSASDLFFTNQTGSAITLTTARIYYYFTTKTGTTTSATGCDATETTINLSSTDIKLYAYIVINGIYQTNHVLLAEYNGYGMEFLRTVTTFGNQAKHYVTYEEILSMLGKRFVLRNNTESELYVIYDTGKNSNGYCTGWVSIPTASSLGFTMNRELQSSGNITSASGQAIYLQMPKYYFKPDDTDKVVIDLSRTAFNSVNFGEQVYFE